MIEEWRSVVGYECLYSVSNLGMVRSHHRGSVKILKGGRNSEGYLTVKLYKNGKGKTNNIHSLVAVAFLGYTPNGFKGLVVDHIKNNERWNNRVDNLQLVTSRKNSSKDRIGCTSKYTGVSWSVSSNKWQAQIRTNGKAKHLGYFHDEYEAHLTYQEALKQVI